MEGVEIGDAHVWMSTSKANSGTAALDVNSPEFDLEKYLLKISKENP
jgi:hypothetical protein